MASSRFAPAGLLVVHGRHRVVFDGGLGAQLPEGRVDVRFVAEEHAELRSTLRGGCRLPPWEQRDKWTEKVPTWLYRRVAVP